MAKKGKKRSDELESRKTGAIQAEQTEDGKLAITLRMSPRDAEKLVRAFVQGKLAPFKVESVSVSGTAPLELEVLSDRPTDGLDRAQNNGHDNANSTGAFTQRIKGSRSRKPQKGRE